MTKRTIFISTIGVICCIIAIRIYFAWSLFSENFLKFFHSIPDFEFAFSFSHFINMTALAVFLYLVFIFDEKKELNIFKRYWYTLKDHDIIHVKLVFFVFPLTIIFFTFLALWNAPKMPEILILIILFILVGSFEFIKKRKLANNANKKTYLFTDEPIEKYSQLNDFQKIEVDQLKSLLDAGLYEYFSIALNGSWGSGKTSILKGLKNLLEGDPESENFKSNYEVFELNLWQARTPENAINELDRLFTELFNKVYLNVSSNDLAFFSLLSGSENSWFNTSLNKLIGENDPMPTTRDRLEKKLKLILNHLKKQKLVILIDDLDRLPGEYLNGFLKIICYVTGLKNVVTISGINREKILSQHKKAEEITILADGVSAIAKYVLGVNNNESSGKNISGKESNQEIETQEKKEFRFTQFDNETFLTKIFTVQKELINSHYHIKNFVNINKENISVFQTKITFKDKEDIIKGIIDFIEKNKECFNTYRDIKLFLNEVFIYLIGFGGKKQSEIRISDYIDIDSILAMAWAKIVYPEFYKKAQDYIIPFMYREQSISNVNDWKLTYNFDLFKKEQYLYFDDGKELPINTRAHRQLKLIFEELNDDASLINPDAGIKYFHPVIEPYEFTTVEFFNLFKSKNIVASQVSEFITRKGEVNPLAVFNDFINRLKLREFKLSERLISASALLDFSSFIFPSNSKVYENQKEEFWRKIISLFQNEFLLGKAQNFQVIKDLYTNGNSLKEIFELWEKMTELKINDTTTATLSHLHERNLFYKFFNASDFNKDSKAETIKNYKYLIREISNHKFEKKENKIVCLVYTYNLALDFWGGEKKIHPTKTINFDLIVPIFLKSLLSFIDSSSSLSYIKAIDCPLIYRSVAINLDYILFKSENLDKLFHLFKNNVFSFSEFMNRIKERVDGSILNKDQRETAYEQLFAFIDANPKLYNSEYIETLQKFFKIESITN